MLKQKNTKQSLVEALGKDTVQELDSLPAESVNSRIVQANQAMKQVAEELEANEKYQELKASKNALEQGKKDVNKRQNMIIRYCLLRLEEQGKA